MAKSQTPREAKKQIDLFGDEKPSSAGLGDCEDFAALFAQSQSPLRQLRAGDMFKGEILSIGKEEAFVSTGTPVDGALPTVELLDRDKQLKYKPGDVIEVRVARVREGEIFLRKADSTAVSADVESLEDAFDMEIPIEGRVTEVVKGGARVQLLGSKLAFCPISQLDIRRVEDASEFIGKKFDFIVTQFENGGRNIVVSRRKILEQRKAESEGVFLENQKPGDILHGKITRIETYGAFVELEDGVDGLIPISEIAWGRVQHPGDVVSIGQDVDVALLRVSEEDGRMRVSLSLKQGGGEGDPWTRVAEDFPLGRILEGDIERKEPYGLFVRISPSIVGLLPRSKWRDHVDGASFENRKKGERIKVQIDEIQAEEHKITLAPPSDFDDGAWRVHQAAAGGFGTLGDLLKGAAPKKPR